ncbi:MAG: FAD-binding protein [Pseudomonadota bacterium]|nr:FAD-binding protein [Pseudomonadota bacterium]
MKTLVYINHDQKKIQATVLSMITALGYLTEEYDAVVIGCKCDQVVNEVLLLPGCKHVWTLDHPGYEGSLAENTVPVLEKLINDQSYERVVFASGTESKNILPRLAASFDVSPVTDICAIESTDVFRRPIYAGNAIQKVKLNANKHFLSIRPASFVKSNMDSPQKTTLSELEPLPLSSKSKVVSQVLTQNDKPDLSSASVVISGGRGMGSADSFKMIDEMADVLSAAVGASRAAVDAGFRSNDHQVGQTGKIIAPDVYWAIGISGAIQHLAGMKDSGIVVAINKDADAPIFQHSDFGLVADLFEVLPKIIQYIQDRSN